MKLENIHIVYFIGVGGIGMSALARYFHHLGKEVAGYDSTVGPMTNALQKEGIAVHFEDDPVHIPEKIRNAGLDQVLVVQTPAVKDDNKELNWFRRKGFRIQKRAQVLGELTLDRYTIAVAGTHGKTTTTALLAHLLNSCGIPCDAFLGGVSVNYDSNLVLAEGAEVMVVEADEYGRSFLELTPDIAVVTSMDPDHLDVYGTGNEMISAFQEFLELVSPNGVTFLQKDLMDQLNAKGVPYGSSPGQAGCFAENLRIENGVYKFDLELPDQALMKDFDSLLPGKHNVENAVAAIAVAWELGADEGSIRKGLRSFLGIKRRFEYRIRDRELVYIDDYAHHPKELDSTIGAVKELFPDKKVTGVFQPHLYSRTRDLAEEFARSLEQLDELYLLEIYPARETPIQGVDAGLLFRQVNLKEKKLLKKEELIPELENKDLEVLLTLGAGDIDRLAAPLEEMLNERINTKRTGNEKV